MSEPVKASLYITNLYAKYLADAGMRDPGVAATLTLAHVVHQTACDLVELIKSKEVSVQIAPEALPDLPPGQNI